MDLSLFSYKSRFKIALWIFLASSLFISFAHSWRITQKCPHGHYFNDGCTACWCDTRTGYTKCEKLPKCARIQEENDKCPRGRQFKDNCGNDCACYESTGAVFCNEKRRCPQEALRNPMPIKIQTTTTLININNNEFQRRGGQAAPSSNLPSSKAETIRYRPSSTSTTTPIPTRRWSKASPSRSYTTHRSSIFDKVSVASSPHPQLRIPGRGRSEELIIEPAIIIRQKGSNKANIVRNPSSATSVHVSSRGRNPGGGSIYLRKHNGEKHISSPSSYSSNKLPTKQSHINPLLLYERQLKAILDMKKAYAKILGSKVNFNFQIATGQVGNPTVTIQQQQKQPPQNNGLIFFQNKNDNMETHTTEHPRRFDSDYENSTVLFNAPSSSSTPSSLTIQQFKPLMSFGTPFFWHKEHLKNTLKQFSPIPPLKELVSYVSSSTENYLSQFLNNLGSRNKQVQISPETTTTNPPPSNFLSPAPTQLPAVNYFPTSQSLPPTPPTPNPTLPPPSPTHFQPYSTISPHEESFHDPGAIPVHQVYQSHSPKPLVPWPTQPSQISSPMMNHHPNGYQNYPPTFQSSYYQNSNDNRHKGYEQPPHFPYVTEIMQELAREDHGFPTATPRTSPALTALPTFQTPGPPYAEVDVVQPLSFLPPPRPEPATPTRRIFNLGRNGGGRFPPYNYHSHHPHPTVRVNLDKPIFVNPQQKHPPQQRPPPPISHHPRPNHQFFPPYHQQNRRVFSRLPPPPPPQLHYVPPPPPRFSHQPQYFIPKPKQYRLVLKGPMREAAIRMDDAVPNFVEKIAHEFFKKPEIYVPKIRPGKPLTLEKVVLNHKKIVPEEMMFAPTTPGSVPSPMTKLRFTPEAQWEMKEELARHGIMLNEPLHNPVRDYALNDPNVMEMDAPLKSIQTWETHTGMGMGTLPDSTYTSGGGISAGGSSLLPMQMPPQNPFLLPYPMTPTQQSTSLDQQQQPQHHILLAQQNQQSVASSGSTNDNDNAFTIDPGDFNDFAQAQQQQQQQQQKQQHYPPELNIPGVQQVIVDKFIVHDPMDPKQPVKMYSTTTVQPPTTAIENRVDLSPILSSPQRTGLPSAAAGLGSTPAPSVLIRHHGAPSSTTTPQPIPPTSPTSSVNSFMVTVINSTPQPQIVTTTIAPFVVDMPSSFHSNNPSTLGTMTGGTAQVGSLAGTIQEFLTDQMDFGARPQMDLFDVLFNSRPNPPQVSTVVPPIENNDKNFEATQYDQIAVETRSREDPNTNHNFKTSEGDDDKNKEVETDRLASIFSLDYKSKYGRKPPEVIVIKVPPEHSDGPFPKIVEKRKGEEIEILGGRIESSKGKGDVETSTENSVGTSTAKSVELSSEKEQSDENYSSKNISSSKRRRNRKKKRRKKGRRRNKNRNRDDEYNDNDEDDDRGNLRSSKVKSDNEENSDIENSGEESKSNKNAETIEKDNNANNGTSPDTNEAEHKFQQELDWKSKLMANICELNPSSPLCLTYRSICLLMTSDD